MKLLTTGGVRILAGRFRHIIDCSLEKRRIAVCGGQSSCLLFCGLWQLGRAKTGQICARNDARTVTTFARAARINNSVTVWRTSSPATGVVTKAVQAGHRQVPLRNRANVLLTSSATRTTTPQSPLATRTTLYAQAVVWIRFRRG